LDPDAVGMESAVGRGMGVLHGGGNRVEEERAVLGMNFRHPIVTSGDSSTPLHLQGGPLSHSAKAT